MKDGGKTGTLQADKILPYPVYLLPPPQDVIITTNMLLVTHLQYLSRFMCKNKTVFLRSCTS